MTKEKPYLDRKMVGRLMIPLFLSGLFVWPLAFGAGAAATALTQGDMGQALSRLFSGLVGSLVSAMMPVGVIYALVKLRRVSVTMFNATVLLLVVTLIAMLVTNSGGTAVFSLLFMQAIAFLPACIGSFVFGNIALAIGVYLKARSPFTFAVFGGLVGLLPAGAMILLNYPASTDSVGRLERIASVLGFWCVGGAAAATVIWLFWQRELRKDAKAAPAHPPADPLEPQPQP